MPDLMSGRVHDDVRERAGRGVAHQGRQAARARRRPASSARPRCRTCRRSPSRACRATSRSPGAASRCAAGTPQRGRSIGLNKDLNAVLAMPEMRQKLAEQGAEAIGGPPEAFAQAHRRRAREVVARHQDRQHRRQLMGFLSARAERARISASARAAQRARELRAAGQEHHRAGAGRAGLQHARPRDRGGVPRDARRPDALHAGRRHARAEGRDRRQVQARERPRVQAGEHLRRRRRQAGALQRAHGDARPGRRGADPGAVLGGVRRHHAFRRRRAGLDADAAGARLQAAPRGAGASHYARNANG